MMGCPEQLNVETDSRFVPSGKEGNFSGQVTVLLGLMGSHKRGNCKA
jgi:hypothetical protein